MLKKILLLALVSCYLLASTQAWEDMKDRLKNRIIHFETTAERGVWLMENGKRDSAGSGLLWVDPFQEKETYFTPKVQFRTSLCGGGEYLCIESMSMQYHYLAVGAKKDLKLERVDSNPMLNDNRFHWKVLCVDNTLNKCKVIPIHFEGEGYLMVTMNGIEKGHYNGVLEKDREDYLPRFWRIHAPNPSDKYIIAFQTINRGSTEQAAQYTMTVGISEERSSTHTITKTASMEVSMAFEAFSASASSSIEDVWEHSKSSNFEKSKSVSHTLKIPPKTKIILYQLVGSYDHHFRVGTDYFAIDEEPLEAKSDKGKRFYDMRFRKYFLRK